MFAKRLPSFRITPLDRVTLAFLAFLAVALLIVAAGLTASTLTSTTGTAVIFPLALASVCLLASLWIAGGLLRVRLERRARAKRGVDALRLIAHEW